MFILKQKHFVLLFSLFVIITSPIQLRAAPPRHEAIEQLEKAREAKNPVEHLRRAIKDLEETGAKTQNRAKDAIVRIERAISAHEKGDHKLMEVLIKEAIEEVRKHSEIIKRKKR